VAFTIPTDLAPEVYPLAWLVGRWEGEGVITYPTIPEARIRQELLVDHDGGPYLRWSSTLWLEAAGGVDDAGPPDDHRARASDGTPDHGSSEGSPDDAADVGDRGPVWATEAGYWRLPPDRPAGLPENQRVVELLLADPAGHLTLYAGTLGSGRIDLASDLIARTPDAAEVTAATRMYGLVHGELMWAWDIAAFGEPLQSYASVQLRRVP
jgi:hypothetical protein